MIQTTLNKVGTILPTPPLTKPGAQRTAEALPTVTESGVGRLVLVSHLILLCLLAGVSLAAYVVIGRMFFELMQLGHRLMYAFAGRL